jgi:hypothetical protein
MRIRVFVGVSVLIVAAAGCLRAGPPKTPNQREVEAEAARRERARAATGTAPAPAPLPPLHNPPPLRER